MLLTVKLLTVDLLKDQDSRAGILRWREDSNRATQAYELGKLISYQVLDDNQYCRYNEPIR